MCILDSITEQDANNAPELKRTQKQRSPDGGWGYMVVIGSFINYFIADGWAYSFGVLYIELLDTFDKSHGTTAVIGALVYAVPLILSPIVCTFCNLFGCKKIGIAGGTLCGCAFIISAHSKSINILILSLGVMASTGLSMIYLSSILSVTYYFEKKRGLALGLAVTGSGLGAFTFPLLSEFLVDKYTWRGTFFIIGAIFFNVIPCSLLFRPLEKTPHVNQGHKNQMQTSPSCEESSSSNIKNRMMYEIKELRKATINKDILVNFYFLSYCASAFIAYLWIGTIYVYLVDKVLLTGFSLFKASLLLSIIGIGRTFGQIILGYLGDISSINSILLYLFCIVMCGLMNILLPLCVSYVGLISVCVVFGFFVSSTYVLQIVCLIDMLGLEKATGAFGFLQLVEGVATFLGTPLTGWMYDELQSYNLSFYIAGAMLLFSSLLLFPVFIKSIKSNCCRNEA